tara:strand:- start:431 stop:1636 length:1206 start_codon:yes stop_codon:yes gene_type:complete
MSSNDYNSHIIPRPEKITYKNEYSEIVIVDSRDRNKYIYKNPNQYIMHFNSAFTSVTEIELISAYYKYSQYEFNNNNNKIYLSNLTKSNSFSVTLGNGNYTTENMETHINKKLLNQKNILDLDYEITSKYNKILDRFYFVIDSGDRFKLHFKGSEKSYVNSLYGNLVSNTQIFDYKLKTNGLFFGFSEDDFSNTLNLYEMKIICINQSMKKHKISITIKEQKSMLQLIDSLNLYDDNTKIYFENTVSGENVSYIVENTNILGFEKETSEKINIYVNLDEIINNNGIINPTFYTNIIVGDILRNDLNSAYVLLDINECSRLESTNKNIQDSYVKIPINQNEHIYFDNTKNHGTVKYFNPVLPKLDRFTIKIKNRDGTIVDSNGGEHTLIFAIKSLNSKNNLC